MSRFWILASVLLWLPLSAAPMNKCVSREGRVTYTSDPCPHDSKSASTVKLQTPARSTSDADTPEEAFLRARRAADEEGVDAWLKHMDTGALNAGGREGLERVFRLVQSMELRNYRIVEKQVSEDQAALKVDAEARNPFSKQRGQATGDIVMVRKSGRWLIDAENWNMK